MESIAYDQYMCRILVYQYNKTFNMLLNHTISVVKLLLYIFIQSVSIHCNQFNSYNFD